MKYIFTYFLLFISLWSFGQKREVSLIPTNSSDTIVVDNGKKDSVTIYKPIINDYLYRKEKGSYKVIDTTFTVQHSYVYTQYNNKDNFGKVQFANIGAGFQDLMYTRNSNHNLSLLPTNKSHFIIGERDVNYYDVKTPTTSFLYHTAMRNGAALQSRYTQNFGKNFNFAAEYMGLRSLGFYNQNLAANNNTIFSSNFKSKNQRYELFTHYIHQNINNEENGGIADIGLFLGDDTRFNNRLNIPMNLSATNSRYANRRYYLSHSYAPFDSEKFPFKMNHVLKYQTNSYLFNLGTSDAAFFGDTDATIGGSSRKYSKDLSNTVSLIFNNPKFYLDAGVKHQHLTLGRRQTVNSENRYDEYAENRIGAVGNLKIKLWEKFDLNSQLEYTNGKTFGNFLKSDNDIRFEPIKDFYVDGKVLFQSSAPSFNYLLNYSPVKNYNFNFMNFQNENVVEIGGKAGVKWFDTQFFVRYFKIANYTYFNSEGTPNQSESSLDVSQIGGEATFHYNKFHLNTRLQFQSNLSNKELLPTPEFIGRANVYYKTAAFKNAADIMAGVKFYYFSKFKSREFSPILNEFILPSANGFSIGGEPIVDVYINMKVKTMQFYIEGQNITTTFMKNKSFAAPYYPLYDFRLNIGLLWNLFH